MKSKTWIEKVRKMAMIFIEDFSDYDKLTKEEIKMIGWIQTSIFNDLGDWDDLKEKK